MTVRELIEKLQTLPQEAKVQVSVQEEKIWSELTAGIETNWHDIDGIIDLEANVILQVENLT